MLPPDEVTKLIAYTLSGLSAVSMAIALLVFKPRVPARRPGQALEAYWSTPEIAQKAFLVWFMMDGAAILASVGYLMTGELVSVATMAGAIALFWLTGPQTFAKD